MAVEPSVTGPLTLGQVLDRAFRLYRARPGALILTAAAAWVPMGLLWGVVMGPQLGGLFGFDLLTEATPGAEGAARSLAILALSIVLLPLLAMLYILVAQALASQVLSLLRGETLSTGQAYRAAFSRFGSYFGSLFLQTMSVAGLTVPIYCCGAIILVLGLSGTAGLVDDNPAASAAAVAGFVVGALVLVAAIFLPYIYLLSRWIAALPGIADQRWGSLESLRRSWDLTHGLAWRTLGFYILLQSLGIFFTLFLALPLTALVTILVPGQLGAVIQGSLGYLPEVLWQPLHIAAVVFYYLDLRVRHESLDLEARLRLIETGGSPAPPPGSPQVPSLPHSPQAAGAPGSPQAPSLPSWPPAPLAPAPLPPNTTADDS